MLWGLYMQDIYFNQNKNMDNPQIETKTNCLASQTDTPSGVHF